MAIFYIVLSAAIGIAVGFFIFKKFFFNKYSKQIEFYNSLKNEKGTGRYGIVRIKGKGTIEFQEVIDTKDWIKINIINVYPDNSTTESEVLESISFKGWIASVHNDYYIEWFSDNSMRLRDEKIKEIVDDKGDN